MRFFVPVILNLTKRIKNKYIKGSIDTILFISYAVTFSFFLGYLIKSVPKSQKELRQIKLSKYENKAFAYWDKQKYDSAFLFIDSAQYLDSNKIEYLEYKYKLKYLKGELNDAVNIVTRLIDSFDNQRGTDEYFIGGEYSKTLLYLNDRSMYNFELGNFQSSINDIRRIITGDEIYDTFLDVQLILEHLLINKTDSSIFYLIKAQNSKSVIEDEGKRKEMNILNALISLRKGDKVTACAFYNNYNLQDTVLLYSNYGWNRFDNRIENFEKMYKILFLKEFDEFSKVCK